MTASGQCSDGLSLGGLIDPNVAPMHVLFGRIVESERSRAPELDFNLGSWRSEGVLDLKSPMRDDERLSLTTGLLSAVARFCADNSSRRDVFDSYSAGELFIFGGSGIDAMKEWAIGA